MNCPACGFAITGSTAACPSCGWPEARAGAPAPGTWWSRHWKKAVPLGCLGLTLLFVVGVLAIIFLVFGVLRSNEVVEQAVERAGAHPAVVQKLGTPIEPGWMITGSIQSSPGRGEAKLTIPITGPRGAATIYANAEKRGGNWEFSVLEVAIEGEPEKIDLLASPHGILEQ